VQLIDISLLQLGFMLSSFNDNVNGIALFRYNVPTRAGTLFKTLTCRLLSNCSNSFR